MAGLVKHNAPGAHINPHLKIHREDLLLLPTADYQRLVESRSPSPLPEHSDRIISTSGEMDSAIAAAAAAAAGAMAADDQSSSGDSEPEGAADERPTVEAPTAKSAGDDPDGVAARKDDQQTGAKLAAPGDHRSSISRSHP